MAQQEKITLMEFMTKFNTEDACREHLYQLRWPDGFVCPKCGAKDNPFNIVSKHRYQCRHCNHQTTVTAGTIMDKSRTPLTKWFLAIYLMGQDKRGCSALKLKKELGIAYDTAWTMSHKIRNAMAQRDTNYSLGGVVEIDESFFGSARAGGKRGRGTEKTAVVFAVSLDKKGNPEFMRAKVLDRVNGSVLTAFAEENIDPSATIKSDAFKAYNKLNEHGYKHEGILYDPHENPEHLKWLHIIVSNVKSFIGGTYHGLENTHLQAYMDEFTYRFNRRFWHDQLFNRILLSCVHSTKFIRYDLIGYS